MGQEAEQRGRFLPLEGEGLPEQFVDRIARLAPQSAIEFAPPVERPRQQRIEEAKRRGEIGHAEPSAQRRHRFGRHVAFARAQLLPRSEEHTSELQSLMRISYAVFCLKKKKIHMSTVRSV